MANNPAEQDTSIEEILASIRQIISEDDKPAESAPEPVVAQTAVAEPASDVDAEDVFELVDRVVAEEEPETTPVVAQPMPEPEPEAIEVDLQDNIPEPFSEPVQPRETAPISVATDESNIFTDGAAAATLGAFTKLSETILVERQRAIAGASVTLEDIVKELLAPLLREWIDHHVPGLVERLVREELEKLARQAREG